MEFAVSYLRDLKRTLDCLPLGEIEQVCEVLFEAYQRGKTVYLFGNGGSAALASHMACDLGKGTFAPDHIPLPGVKRFKVLSLTDNVPMMSAWANDTSYENIFAEQLANFIEPSDVAFGISGSGNSPNVLRALEIAQRKSAVRIGLTGFQGGKLKELVDYAIVVRSNSMQHIEDTHLVIAHIIFQGLQTRISGYRTPAKILLSVSH